MIDDDNNNNNAYEDQKSIYSGERRIWKLCTQTVV
jgi:hypothetical protein